MKAATTILILTLLCSPFALSSAAQTKELTAMDHFKRGYELAEKANKLQGEAAMKGLDAAIAEFREAVRLRPDYAEAHSLLGYCLAFRSDPAKGLAECREAARLAPKDIKLLNPIWTILALQKDFDGEYDLVHQALHLDPENLIWRTRLAQTLRSLGNDEGALAQQRDASMQHTDMPEAYAELARALRSNGNWEGAEAEYRAALRIKQDSSIADELNKLLKEKTLLDRLTAECREKIAKRPGDASLHYQLGSYLQIAGKWQEAATEYREALRLGSNQAALIHYWLGRVLLQANDLDGAIRELQESTKVASGATEKAWWPADAQLCIAHAFGRKGDKKAAQEHRALARQLDPRVDHSMIPPAPPVVAPPPPPPPPSSKKP